MACEQQAANEERLALMPPPLEADEPLLEADDDELEEEVDEEEDTKYAEHLCGQRARLRIADGEMPRRRRLRRKRILGSIGVAGQ